MGGWLLCSDFSKLEFLTVETVGCGEGARRGLQTVVLRGPMVQVPQGCELQGCEPQGCEGVTNGSDFPKLECVFQPTW